MEENSVERELRGLENKSFDRVLSARDRRGDDMKRIANIPGRRIRRAEEVKSVFNIARAHELGADEMKSIANRRIAETMRIARQRRRNGAAAIASRQLPPEGRE